MLSKILSLLCFSLLTLSSVNAATYYVSSSTGSDRNAGTNRNAPWKSFSPIYQRVWSFQPGDSILFCQGDSWFYSNLFAFASGTSTQPITWGSYQCRSTSTAKPVISPSVLAPATAWSISSSNPNVLVYNLARDSIAVANGIRSLWAGDVRQLGARSPNLIDPLVTHGQAQSEFYFASTFSVINGRIQTIAALTQAANYWVGAVIYMRINNWTYQQSVVTASGPGWLQVRDWPNTGQCAGFYLENGGSASNAALLQVDAPGEFVFNRADNNLYFWPSSAALRTAILAGTAQVNFLYGNAASAAVVTGNNHIIQDISFKFAVGGIVNGGARTFTVQRNSVKGVNGFGIVSDNANGALITANIVDDADGDCIFLNSYQGNVNYNNVSRCGVVAGYGFIQGATNNGITAHQTSIAYNTINGVGYNGIEPHYGASVSYNIINDVLKTLNDGGAIYMYGQSGNGLVLQGNSITGVTGNWLSWTQWNIASCVFTDQGTSAITIYNNTCSQAPQCMQLNDAEGNLILSNTCNAPGIYLNDGYSGGGHMVIGNQITTSGTSGILQNPIARVYAPGQSNLQQVFSAYYENVYCQNWNVGTYLYQKDFGSNGVWRYMSFNDWKNGECALTSQTPCPFERNSAFYTSNCATYRPFFFGGNSVSDLIQDGGFAQSSSPSSSGNAAEIAAPVVASIVAVTLVIVFVIVAARYYAKHKASSSAESTELPLSAQSSRPMSPEVSFNSLPSPASQAVVVELHTIPAQ